MSAESSAAPVTAADLRPVDLFDDIDDAALVRVGRGGAGGAAPSPARS